MAQELESSFDAICESVAHELGFKVEHGINLGAGHIDQVWSRQDHPNMPEMKFAVQIIAEVTDVPPEVIGSHAMASLWTDCDHLIFVVPDQGTQKSIQGKVRSFDAIGGFLQLHKYITTITISELTKGLSEATRTTAARA